MNLMSKKKPKNAGGEEEVRQVIFRPETNDLVRAIDAEAKKDRRSRNLTIIILLEEALRARGVWPPG